jgi:hypothetical protein
MTTPEATQVKTPHAALLVHLSDLRIVRDAARQALVLDKLVETLAREREKSSAERIVIAITGDVFDSATDPAPALIETFLRLHGRLVAALEALCRTVGEAASCYGVDTGFEWVGLLCRYGAARATLRLAQRNAGGLEPFGSVTDLTTGRERPVTVNVEREQWSIACETCSPRSLLRIYWPLALA